MLPRVALGFLVPDNGPDKCLTPSLVPDLSLTGWEALAHVREENTAGFYI